jgi:hypothetical protein
MATNDARQALTLRFVVLLFLRTGSGGGGPLVTAGSVFAIVLSLALPLYVVLLVVDEFR